MGEKPTTTKFPFFSDNAQHFDQSFDNKLAASQVKPTTKKSHFFTGNAQHFGQSFYNKLVASQVTHSLSHSKRVELFIENLLTLSAFVIFALSGMKKFYSFTKLVQRFEVPLMND